MDTNLCSSDKILFENKKPLLKIREHLQFIKVLSKEIQSVTK